RVKQMGYDAVQCSGMGPIDPKELKKILDGEGLVCCATHVGLDRLRDQTRQVIEEHQLWGCHYTAIGGFFRQSYTTKDWLDFAEAYNAIARSFQGSGVELGYHNHSHELSRWDGKTAMQWLLE